MKCGKLLLPFAILLPVVASAQTPTLQDDINALSAVLKNLQALVPPPPPPPSCVGTPIVAPAVGALIMPPVVPQPAVPADIVGVKLQNTSTTTSPAYVTFGQVFKQGQVQPTDGLAGAQMDAETLWPDGSVKMAAVTVPGNLCAGDEQPLLLTKAPPGGASLSMPAVALTATVGSATVDLGASLPASTDVWLKGPLAIQKRVDVPVPGQPTLHITADVTAYADGSVLADVQFNNDLTTLGTAINPPALPPIVYTPSITLNGKATTLAQVTQYQYQDWHVLVGAVPSVNIQHDAAYLEATGAVLKYDLTTGVLNGPGTSGNAFDSIGKVLASPGFGAPLSANTVDKYQPDVGGRPDIDWINSYATV